MEQTILLKGKWVAGNGELIESAVVCDEIVKAEGNARLSPIAAGDKEIRADRIYYIRRCSATPSPESEK